ncbi:MAG: putative baseplate assembly protein, partial [Caldilineaceae bacterium]
GTPGQTFYVAHTPVVPRLSSLEYVVVRAEDGREERWKEVSDFGSSKADDLHYTLDSNTGEIRFGPALPRRDGSVQLFGAVPAKGSQIMIRQYRHGGGAGGNLAANTLTVLKTSIPYIAKVTNRFPASGGIDAEKLETAKERVPDYLRSLNRAVTAEDYEYLAQEAAPGLVARAHCVQAGATPGEVRVLIVPRIPNLIGPIAPQSLGLTADLRDRIAAYLDERRLLGTRLEVSPPAYQWVDVDVRFRPAVGSTADDVRQAVEDRLYAFLNPITGGQDGKGWPFGRDLFLADIMAILLPIRGVDFVRSVRLFPVGYVNGQFVRGDEASQVAVPDIATIASYHHDVRVE